MDVILPAMDADGYGNRRAERKGHAQRLRSGYQAPP
jgi:hypothetical protein